MPNKNKMPKPVQIAFQALEALKQTNPDLADGLRKKLPALALALDKSGQEVSVEILLTEAQKGEEHLINLAKEFKQAIGGNQLSSAPKTYKEIMGGKYKVTFKAKSLAIGGDIKELDKLYKKYRANILDKEQTTQLGLDAAANNQWDIMKYLIDHQGYRLEDNFGNIASNLIFSDKKNVDLVYKINEFYLNKRTSDERSRWHQYFLDRLYLLLMIYEIQEGKSFVAAGDEEPFFKKVLSMGAGEGGLDHLLPILMQSHKENSPFTLKSLEALGDKAGKKHFLHIYRMLSFHPDTLQELHGGVIVKKDKKLYQKAFNFHRDYIKPSNALLLFENGIITEKMIESYCKDNMHKILSFAVDCYPVKEHPLNIMKRLISEERLKKEIFLPLVTDCIEKDNIAIHKRIHTHFETFYLEGVLTSRARLEAHRKKAENNLSLDDVDTISDDLVAWEKYEKQARFWLDHFKAFRFTVFENEAKHAVNNPYSYLHTLPLEVNDDSVEPYLKELAQKYFSYPMALLLKDNNMPFPVKGIDPKAFIMGALIKGDFHLLNEYETLWWQENPDQNICFDVPFLVENSPVQMCHDILERYGTDLEQLREVSDDIFRLCRGVLRYQGEGQDRLTVEKDRRELFFELDCVLRTIKNKFKRRGDDIEQFNWSNYIPDDLREVWRTKGFDTNSLSVYAINKSPYHLNGNVYDYAESFVKEEFSEVKDRKSVEDVAFLIAYKAGSLFDSEKQCAEYFDRWGGAVPRTFTSLLEEVYIPYETKTDYTIIDPNTGEEKRVNATIDMKAWGDAVVQCGPRMAKLVRYATKLEKPERSDDGKHWSYPNTRDKLAPRVFQSGDQSPELAKYCLQYGVDQKGFDELLEEVKKVEQEQVKSRIPEVTIDGKFFEMPGATFYKLPDQDIRGLFLGNMIDCCQTVTSNAKECALHGYRSEHGGFYVIEKDKKIIGATWAWVDKNNVLVFDSLEMLGSRVKKNHWEKICRNIANRLKRRKKSPFSALTVGQTGNTPNLSFPFHKEELDPIDAKPYDSKQRYLVWSRKIV